MQQLKSWSWEASKQPRHMDQGGIQKVGGFCDKYSPSSGGGLVQQLRDLWWWISLIWQLFMEKEESVPQDKTKEEKTISLKSRITLQEWGCFNPEYSSLRRWRFTWHVPPNTSIGSGYSSDSLLPTFWGSGWKWTISIQTSWSYTDEKEEIMKR